MSKPLIEVMLDAATHGASEIAESFDTPDGEWAPILFVANDTQLNIVGLPSELFKDERSKNLLVDLVIPSIAEEFHATGLCFMGMATSYDQEIESGKIDDTSRKDQFVVIAVTQDHGAIQMGLITRYPDKPPTLEWDEAEIDPDVFEGRIPDALRIALDGVPS
jgi:hypothetical protein